MGLAGTRPAGAPRPEQYSPWWVNGERRYYLDVASEGVALACALYAQAVPAHAERTPLLRGLLTVRSWPLGLGAGVRRGRRYVGHAHR